jgi:hypothetical protein
MQSTSSLEACFAGFEKICGGGNYVITTVVLCSSGFKNSENMCNNIDKIKISNQVSSMAG